MKTTIYEALHIGGVKIIFDTEKGMILDSEPLGMKIAETPDGSIGGAYTAREIAEAWLENEHIAGMAGRWVYDQDDLRENKDRLAVVKWLKGKL